MDELNREPLDSPDITDSATPQTAVRTAGSQSAQKILHEIKGWARDILFAVVTAILIVLFVVQPVKVEGTSMLPRLVDQERIFVNRFIYHITDIHRGDIVVFWYPKDSSKSFIKRVIGLPGDLVRIDAGQVYVNGKRLHEDYLDPRFLDHESYPPDRVAERVPEDCYFVLGDHRNSSNDSRNWGVVPRQNIYGKAIFRYWPVSRLGSIE